MTRRLADSRGFVITEVLMVMIVALILLGATLLTFDNFVRDQRTNDLRQEQADIARRGLDVLARQLRNLAKPGDSPVPVIAKAEPYDFLFQTSDPERTWVRYCYDDSLGASRGRVWEQTVASPGQPGASTCPAAWAGGKRDVVADYVTNRNGRDYPMFAYQCNGEAGCAAAGAFDRIINVEAQLLIDTEPGKRPQELRVASSVFLRNQNQAPTAMFGPPTPSGARTLIFNGSQSSDPEGRTLALYWFLNSIPAAANIRCSAAQETIVNDQRRLWGGVTVGQGVTLAYTWPKDAAGNPQSGTQQTIGLVACDPGDRHSTYTRTVTIP